MNKRKKPGLGIYILFMIFLYLSYIAADQQKLLHAKNLEMEKIENKIREEELLNEELTREKEMIQNEEYKEKVAREKLGMVKKNERIFVDVGK